MAEATLDIAKLQEQLHGRVLDGDDPVGPLGDEPTLALPEDIWGHSFAHWCRTLETFFREESGGGTCMENWSQSRFFDSLSAMYWGLKGDTPGAIVRLPLYPQNRGTRLISSNDRAFEGFDGDPMERWFRGSNGLFVDLRDASTLETITKRQEGNYERLKRDMSYRGIPEADRRYFEERLSVFEGVL